MKIANGIIEKEPQMNADERRYKPVTDLGVSHCKVRKDRKAQPQFGTQRAQRYFKHISVSSVHSVVLTCRAGSKFDLDASASTVAPVDFNHTYGHTWRSAFHQVCSSLKNLASGASVSALIRVHLRFFYDVIFQTGLTGSTGYIFDPVNPVILSNLKCQYVASRKSVKWRA